LVGHLYLFTKRTKRQEQEGRLDPGWVEHDADPGSHGLGRQVAAELGAHRAGVPVRAGHLAPDATQLRLLLAVGHRGLVLGLVHESAPLTHIPPGLLLVLAALQLEEGGVLVLVALAALVAREYGLGV
jgi:hypothetical protein